MYAYVASPDRRSTSVTLRAAQRSRRLRVMKLLVAVVSLEMLIPATPVQAIINGAEDGNGHPYVAAIGPPSPGLASGVLISPNVVLIAAHAAERRPGPHAVRVTFDADARSASATWYTGTAYIHPGYAPAEVESYDLAVVVLDEPVAGVTPASLPTENLLDELGPRALSRSTFTGVGYGFSERLGPNGRDPTSGRVRRFAQQTYASVGRQYLRLRMEGDTEVCSGDSGSPTLMGDSSVVAGILVIEWSLAGGECRSLPWYQRVDTPTARDFLAQFVDLP